MDMYSKYSLLGRVYSNNPLDRGLPDPVAPFSGNRILFGWIRAGDGRLIFGSVFARSAIFDCCSGGRVLRVLVGEPFLFYEIMARQSTPRIVHVPGPYIRLRPKNSVGAAQLLCCIMTTRALPRNSWCKFPQLRGIAFESVWTPSLSVWMGLRRHPRWPPINRVFSYNFLSEFTWCGQDEVVPSPPATRRVLKVEALKIDQRWKKPH